MLRIAGVNLPTEKRLAIALTAIYGVGRSLGRKICQRIKLDEHKKIKSLTGSEAEILRAEMAKFLTEGDLRRQVQQNIRLLQDIGTYRGSRHKKRLPCRGQRTSNNARTRRGGKGMTVGSGRKKAEKK